jgi:hypothetical protein
LELLFYFLLLHFAPLPIAIAPLQNGFAMCKAILQEAMSQSHGIVQFRV